MRLWQTIGMKNKGSFLLGAIFVIACLFGAEYVSVPVSAGTASVTYSFSAGQKIVASQVNQNFNDILSTLNGNINTNNILDGGVATADLAASAVTTAKIADSNVTTAKVADLNITKIKLASANIVSANFSPIGAGQDQGGVIASATITLAANRPIRLSVTNSESTSQVSGIGDTTGSYSIQAAIRFGGATESTVSASGSSSRLPCSSLINKIYSPGIGTFTYQIFQNFAGATALPNTLFLNCKLQIEEL